MRIAEPPKHDQHDMMFFVFHSEYFQCFNLQSV